MLCIMWEERGWEVSKLRWEVDGVGRRASGVGAGKKRLLLRWNLARKSRASEHEIWSSEWPKQCRYMKFFLVGLLAYVLMVVS